MTSQDHIVEAYIGADEERRLYMYLSYRELRSRFTEIDLSESAAAPARADAVPPRPSRRLPRFCHGWLRLCGLGN